MKHIILFRTLAFNLAIFGLMTFTSEADAQTPSGPKFSTASLRGTSWTEQHVNQYKRWTYTFTDSVIIDSTYYNLPDREKVYVSKKYYYMSDTIPAKFDFTQVGKITTGYYLVRWTDGVFGCNRITCIDEQKFIGIHPVYHDEIVFLRNK